MVKLKLTRKHAKNISITAMVLVALMLADTLYQIGMHVHWRVWLPASLAAQPATTQPAETQPASTQPADAPSAQTQPTSTKPADTQPSNKAQKAKKKESMKTSKPPEIHAAITKRNIFTKHKPQNHGLTLTGVLGQTALFDKKDGKSVAIEEGKSAQGVKVVSIKDYEVTIEYKGKTETMKLFSGSSAGCWSAGDAHAAGPSVMPPGAVRGPSGGAPPPDAHEPAKIESAKRAAIRELSGRRAMMMQRRQAVMIESGASPQTQEAQ